MKTRYRKRQHVHTGAKTTIQQLLDGATTGHHSLSHDANFKRILPQAMAKLVAEGLFEPDGLGSYKITAKGREVLKRMETEE